MAWSDAARAAAAEVRRAHKEAKQYTNSKAKTEFGRKALAAHLKTMRAGREKFTSSDVFSKTMQARNSTAARNVLRAKHRFV